VKSVTIHKEATRRFQMPRRQPPKGYYRASEAEKILNISNAMIRTYVQKGAIKYLVPEGMKQGFYKKEDVDKLAASLNAFISIREEDEEEITTLEVATKEELNEITNIGSSLFVIPIRGENNPTDPSWRVRAHQKNPESQYALKRGREVIGYASILPLKPNSDKINKLLSVELIREANITADDIETYEANKHVVLYIGAIGIKPGIEKKDRRKYGASLVSHLITKIIGLGKRGIIIDKIIAVGATRSGTRLLQAFGFNEIPTLRKGQREFVLEPEKSSSHIALQYLEALKEWGETFGEQPTEPAKA
jgi:hypothetical protein